MASEHDRDGHLAMIDRFIELWESYVADREAEPEPPDLERTKVLLNAMRRTRKCVQRGERMDERTKQMLTEFLRRA